MHMTSAWDTFLVFRLLNAHLAFAGVSFEKGHIFFRNFAASRNCGPSYVSERVSERCHRAQCAPRVAWRALQ